MKREFKLEHTFVTFHEATCVIEGEVIDCLYIVQYHDDLTYECIVANCCTLPKNNDDAKSILFNEYLETSHDILNTMRLK